MHNDMHDISSFCVSIFNADRCANKKTSFINFFID